MKKYVLLMAVLVASLPSGLAAQEKKDPVQAPPPAAPAPAPLKPPVVRAAPADEVKKAVTLEDLMAKLIVVETSLTGVNTRLDKFEKVLEDFGKRLATAEEILRNLKHEKKVYKKDELKKEGTWEKYGGYEYAYKDGGFFVYFEGSWRLAVKLYSPLKRGTADENTLYWHVSWSDVPWTVGPLPYGSATCK